jgi:CheY-like chemotaxis protein
VTADREPRILIVDDNADLRHAMSELFAIAGLEVVGQAENGEQGGQGGQATVDLKPDIVLMDLRMPVMDGLEATRRIVALGLPVRVIMVSADATEGFDQQAFTAGAVDLVPKGVSPSRVLRAIDEAWRARTGNPGGPSARARHAANPG